MLLPTGVAGSDKDACTAESILSMSKVGELGADILSVVVRSRTANSCLRSEKHGQTHEIPDATGSDAARTNVKRLENRFIFTSSFVFQSLHGHQQRFFFIQLTFQEGVSLDGLVQTTLKVLKRHDCCSGLQRRCRWSLEK